MTNGNMDYEGFQRFVKRNIGRDIEVTILGGSKMRYNSNYDHNGLIGVSSPDGTESMSVSPRSVLGYTVLEAIRGPEVKTNDTTIDLKGTGKKGGKVVSESAGSETDSIDSGE